MTDLDGINPTLQRALKVIEQELGEPVPAPVIEGSGDDATLKWTLSKHEITLSLCEDCLMWHYWVSTGFSHKQPWYLDFDQPLAKWVKSQFRAIIINAMVKSR